MLLTYAAKWNALLAVTQQHQKGTKIPQKKRSLLVVALSTAVEKVDIKVINASSLIQNQCLQCATPPLTHVQVLRLRDTTELNNDGMIKLVDVHYQTEPNLSIFTATNFLARYWDCMSSVRPSVCLSVCLSMTLVDQDHTGWKSWKLIARTISINHPPSPRGTWGNLGETRGWVGKSGVLERKKAISLKRVKIEEKLPWRAYRKSQTLFRTVPSPTPYGLHFPKIGGSLSRDYWTVDNANLSRFTRSSYLLD